MHNQFISYNLFIFVFILVLGLRFDASFSVARRSLAVAVPRRTLAVARTFPRPRRARPRFVTTRPRTRSLPSVWPTNKNYSMFVVAKTDITSSTSGNYKKVELNFLYGFWTYFSLILSGLIERDRSRSLSLSLSSCETKILLCNYYYYESNNMSLFLIK